MIKRLARKIRRGKAQYIAPRLDLEVEYLEGYDRESRKIINLLSYTKKSGSTYSGELYNSGYHTLNIGDKVLKGQRNPEMRLKEVPFDFTGKTVLDLGCNQGGMLHTLGSKIKHGVGIDYDYRMINVANKIKSFSNNNQLNFYVFNLESEKLDCLRDFIPDTKVDICFLLSICMWLKNWKEIVSFSKSISNNMLFETNGTDEQQRNQIDYLKSIYKQVKLINEESDDDPLQKKRKLLICTD